MAKIKLNNLQRRAINRVIRFYRKRNAYNGVTSVRIRLEGTDYGVVWLSVDTRRSDCHRYSERAMVCKQTGFFYIGKRGAIKVGHTRDGLSDDRSHACAMLDAQPLS